MQQGMLGALTPTNQGSASRFLRHVCGLLKKVARPPKTFLAHRSKTKREDREAESKKPDLVGRAECLNLWW